MSEHALHGNQHGVVEAGAFLFFTDLPNYLPTYLATFLAVEKYETGNLSLRQGDEEVNKRIRL